MRHKAHKSCLTCPHKSCYKLHQSVARVMLQTHMQQPLINVHDEILLSSGRENPVKLDSLVLMPSVNLF